VVTGPRAGKVAAVADTETAGREVIGEGTEAVTEGRAAKARRSNSRGAGVPRVRFTRILRWLPILWEPFLFREGLH
jgi:hypothetical protein